MSVSAHAAALPPAVGRLDGLAAKIHAIGFPRDDRAQSRNGEQAVQGFLTQLLGTPLPPISRVLLHQYSGPSLRESRNVELAVVFCGGLPDDDAVSLQVLFGLAEAQTQTLTDTDVCISPTILWESEISQPESSSMLGLCRDWIACGTELPL